MKSRRAPALFTSEANDVPSTQSSALIVSQCNCKINLKTMKEYHRSSYMYNIYGVLMETAFRM